MAVTVTEVGYASAMSGDPLTGLTVPLTAAIAAGDLLVAIGLAVWHTGAGAQQNGEARSATDTQTNTWQLNVGTAARPGPYAVITNPLTTSDSVTVSFTTSAGNTTDAAGIQLVRVSGLSWNLTTALAEFVSKYVFGFLPTQIAAADDFIGETVDTAPFRPTVPTADLLTGIPLGNPDVGLLPGGVVLGRWNFNLTEANTNTPTPVADPSPSDISITTGTKRYVINTGFTPNRFIGFQPFWKTFASKGPDAYLDWAEINGGSEYGAVGVSASIFCSALGDNKRIPRRPLLGVGT